VQTAVQSRNACACVHVLKLVCIMCDIHACLYVYKVEEEELKSVGEAQQSLSEVDLLKREIQSLKEKLGGQQRTG